jgi:hypothetical protein
VKCYFDFQFCNWKIYFQGKREKNFTKLPDNKYVIAVVFIVDLVTYFKELSMNLKKKVNDRVTHFLISKPVTGN